MFELTTTLKGQLISAGLAVAGASDADFKSAAMKGLVDGKITPKQLQEWTAPESKPEVNLSKMIAEAVSKSVAEALAANKVEAKPEEKKETQSDVEKTLAVLQSKSVDSASPFVSAAKGADDKVEIRVKSFGERYDATRTKLYYPQETTSGKKHRLAGMPATYGNNELQSCSKLGKAVGAAWFKFQLASSSDAKNIPHALKMTEEDRKLIEYAMHECEFSGDIFGEKDTDVDSSKMITVNRRKLTEFERKGLLDDSTSGGIEIAPIEFDDALVTIPVLQGELFPYVNVQPVTRGRRMKGGSISNPTFGSTAEGTSVTPFDTTSFVSAFDTTIFPAIGSMEIGLDFEDDSPTNIGQIIINKYGEKAMEWLDRVIAVGNGTTEPQGIVNASGIVTLNSDNGTGGPATVSDYEGLLFGVAKQYRQAKGSRNFFIANETSYRRARGIAVGPSDERRVFGMTHQNYNILECDYKIQNSMTNSQIAYANLGFYRMYRRLGLSVRLETQGNYLATRNIRLVVVRMRYGGKLELGGAASLISDGQA